MSQKLALGAVGLVIGSLVFQGVLLFLPLTPLLVFISYGAFGWILGRGEHTSAKVLLWCGLLPAWLLTLVFVWLSRTRLADGIGVFHLINLGVIPLAGVGGFMLGRRAHGDGE